MQNSSVEKLVDDTMNSFDEVRRAEAKPFLITRVFAHLQSKAETNSTWTKVGSFLSTPSIAFTTVLLIIIINAFIIINQSKSVNNTLQNITSAKDEFAINVISIYETENQEP